MCRLSAVIVLSLTAVGCGSGLTTAPVSGVVTLGGQPLPNAAVTFVPEAQGLESPISNGRTDAEGRYTLTVTATGDQGAVVGKHTVRIAFIEEETDSDISDPNTVDPIPPHDLSFEVKRGQNTANFDL